MEVGARRARRRWLRRALCGPAAGVTLADDELVKEFLVESHENLDRMDRELVELEKDPASKELLDDIFRTVHTIKGTCAFLEFTTLEHVAHTGESLLGLLREGKLRFSAQVAN